MNWYLSNLQTNIPSQTKSDIRYSLGLDVLENPYHNSMKVIKLVSKRRTSQRSITKVSLFKTISNTPELFIFRKKRQVEALLLPDISLFPVGWWQLLVSQLMLYQSAKTSTRMRGTLVCGGTSAYQPSESSDSSSTYNFRGGR